MRILIVDDCCHTVSSAIALALSKISTEVEIVDEPVPTIPYIKTDYPASSKYVREKDWIHDKGKNQYKQKRRGRR